MWDNNIDASRLANLDECGVTAGREAAGKTRRKVYMTRTADTQQRTVHFQNVQRVTVVPVIFASGYVGKPSVHCQQNTCQISCPNKRGKRVY